MRRRLGHKVAVGELSNIEGGVRGGRAYLPSFLELDRQHLSSLSRS